MNRMCLVASALPLLLAGALAAQDAPPRTFYESLDLASPQGTAETFLAAYARADYETVFAALSADAQQNFVNTLFRLFDISPYFAGQGVEFLRSTTLGRDSKTFDEFMGMPGVIFDDIMMTAQADAILPFEVAPTYEVSIALVSIDPPMAVARVVTHANPPILSLDLLQFPSGRWKVDRITWDGSDHEMRPWGVAPPTSAGP